MASQQAVAQVITIEMTGGVVLEQGAYEEVLEYSPLIPMIPRDPEIQELRFLDDSILQLNLEMEEVGGEAMRARDGLPSQACGWVDNGDGTVSMTDSCETKP